jgi:hypothetical protein
MITKRRLICAGILAACVALVLVVLAALPARSGVTKANFDRIKAGMTLAEVQAVFAKEGVMFHGFPSKSERVYCWSNEDRSYALVFFDSHKDVVETAHWEESPEDIGDKIRRLIRWPWWK